MHISRYIAFSLITLLAYLSNGCKNGDSETHVQQAIPDSIAVNDSDSIIVTDSMPTDTVISAEIPPRRFYSADSVLIFMNTSPDSAKYREGIIPGIVESSVEYADRLLNNKHEHFIVVDKSTMNLGLYDRYGRLEKAYRFACAKKYGAKHAKRDGRTPEGFFAVQGKYDSTEWLFTNDDGYTSQVRGQYGPRFLRVQPMIGIHGTMSTYSLGGRVSHGCIRLDNRAICQLFTLVDVGTPIIISPGAQDQKVNKSEGSPMPMIKTGLAYDTYKNYTLPDVPEEIMKKLEEALAKSPGRSGAASSDSIKATSDESSVKTADTKPTADGNSEPQATTSAPSPTTEE